MECPALLSIGSRSFVLKSIPTNECYYSSYHFMGGSAQVTVRAEGPNIGLGDQHEYRGGGGILRMDAMMLPIAIASTVSTLLS